MEVFFFIFFIIYLFFLAAEGKEKPPCVMQALCYSPGVLIVGLIFFFSLCMGMIYSKYK